MIASGKPCRLADGAIGLLPDEGTALVSDVRMRGFQRRATVPQAWQWLQQFTTVTDTEVVSLASAAGRVLAGDLISTIDVPAFDRSAMDGYAVRAAETTGASTYNPLRFRIQGESLPGRPAERAVEPGTAIRIMTGAPIPVGATAVVPAEFAQLHGTEVDLLEAVPDAKNIGRRGEDVSRGTVVLGKHRRLRPQDVAVIASLGLAHVEVLRRPVVRIITTGNELVEPGQPRQPFEIYDANTCLLRHLVARDGGVVEEPSLQIPDSRELLHEALTRPGADVLLVSGGSSVGAEDLAPELIQELGSLDIHGIAMRPSSPAGMGTVRGKPVFLLPGNPVSCLCAYDFFAGRVIRRLGGLQSGWPYHNVTRPLLRKIVSSVGRVDYCRVRIKDAGVEPLAISGASILTSTTRADGFVIVPAESEGYATGMSVDVYLYDSLNFKESDQGPVQGEL